MKTDNQNAIFISELLETITTLRQRVKRLESTLAIRDAAIRHFQDQGWLKELPVLRGENKQLRSENDRMRKQLQSDVYATVAALKAQVASLSHQLKLASTPDPNAPLAELLARHDR